MSNFIQALSALEQIILETNTSATVLFETVGQYDLNTPFPLYEIDVIGLQEPFPSNVTIKTATIQIKYHEVSNESYTSLSGFSMKYQIDRDLRSLVKSWHRKIKEELQIPGIATLENVGTTLFDDLTDLEIGWKNARRIAIQFELKYQEL